MTAKDSNYNMLSFVCLLVLYHCMVL